VATIPDFKTLDETIEFWETHDSADYWENLEDVTFDIDLHQNLLHPRLLVLAHQPDNCPRCHQELDDIVIDYATWNDGHLVAIRDVPALRCRANGHEYILEETLDQIEHLLELEKAQKLQPTATLQVPVFSLKMSA
jgi:YgiT-type zinc finger domain-containing protein